uniref:Uncharacterized protein n=1 Tax=Anguilla anguilla TaxID=7936 RepID=A0A0E9U886_ANGAN
MRTAATIRDKSP